MPNNNVDENKANDYSAHADGRLRSLGGMYEDYFLDYASYVILERAVPALEDGLKPVQRRILHSMWELEDGRFNKVANVVGNTMKYHPHGDASINDALVQMGQRELLIDTQGNWGNILTGDSAAAPRYIEARLSKLALDTVFNAKLTEWQKSYDGRNKEPVHLPVKFPLLLTQGVEGIAVGLSCKIFPHNFKELCAACIDLLKGNPITLFPDFPSGGLIDCSKYNDGLRGSRIRVRARINILDHKTLIISEIPYGTTTDSLIDSIVAAGEKGKIKLKKVEDNTADKVEILVHLAPSASPDTTIESLYAFTDCEVIHSPNTCVIHDGKPVFLSVSEILRYNAFRTKELLEKELQIKLNELQEAHLFASIEKIFIENRIYRKIENCETWESILKTIEKGLKPYLNNLYRPLKAEDYTRLTEIRIKRISRFDARKAEELLAQLVSAIEETKSHLFNITDFTIQWFDKLIQKYGDLYPRKTEIACFDNVALKNIVERRLKLYYDRETGFLGYGLKTGVVLGDCSELDEILLFTEEGKLILTKINEKKFVGKNIIHVKFWNKDDSSVYNLIFRDGKNGHYIVKRFKISGISKDKEYDLTRGKSGSFVLYFSEMPKVSQEIITISLKPRPRVKKLIFDLDLNTIAVKGRDSQGIILTKLPIRKITRKISKTSEDSGKSLWFDRITKRFAFTEKGDFVGNISPGQRVFVIMQGGTTRKIVPDVTIFFDECPFAIIPYSDTTVITLVWQLQNSSEIWIKRFVPVTDDKIYNILGEDPGRLLFASAAPKIKLIFSYLHGKNKKGKKEEILIQDIFPIKSEIAKGTRLSSKQVLDVHFEILEEQNENPVSVPQQSTSVKEISSTDISISLDTPDSEPELFG